MILSICFRIELDCATTQNPESDPSQFSGGLWLLDPKTPNLIWAQPGEGDPKPNYLVWAGLGQIHFFSILSIENSFRDYPTFKVASTR